MKRRTLAFPGLLALSACALATADPPQVEVASVQLVGATPLQQSLRVALCVSNPNGTELDFRRVRVAMDVAGAPLAASESEVPVRLPPHSSTVVPFAVATTTANLGPQLASVVQTGALEYRIRGQVQLEGALGISVPFSRSGRLDLVTAANGLLDTAAPGTTRCGRT